MDDPAAGATATQSRRGRMGVEDDERQSSGLTVERDEYGLASAERTVSTPSTANTASAIAGPTVSKILVQQPPSSSIPPTPPHPSQAIRDPLLQSLHDSILDLPHSHLQPLLHHSALQLPDPQHFAHLINGYINGYTPFHHACDLGDLKKVQILCAAGVDRGLKDHIDGLTGIELAREAGRSEVVDFLESLPPQ
ncbi:hypothetical protein VP01_2004g3 [Puccinia sorghi]|uniref:Uncharacterized protein n=1 Tax=Puccinia sorghi TaxID=27349 RepID=A0A0L6VD71_9BASI|nr:hypothetical protein VP01_2004g3 [Puccinia sorghi]